MLGGRACKAGLLALCAALAASAFEHYPGALPEDVPARYILLNDTLEATVRGLATKGPAPTVLFTTMRLPPDAKPGSLLRMVASFCYWLDRAGLLRHTMLLTTDVRTWSLMHKRGFPAYLDRAFPRREEYVHAVHPEGTPNREFDCQKHWWGMRLLEAGLHALYLDSDSAVLVPGKAVLAPFGAPYEVQGLSDWFEAELFPTGSVHASCGIYYLVPEPGLPQGSELRSKWHYHGEQDAAGALSVPNPCQSTGLWYLKPTPLALRFMRAVVARIQHEDRTEWDQTAWNDVLLSFLWGWGDDAQLTYRLLPVDRFSNLGIYRQRREQGLPTGPVVLHAGAIHGPHKREAFEELGLFHGNFSLPSRPGADLLGGWAVDGARLSAVHALYVLAAVAGALAMRGMLRRRARPSRVAAAGREGAAPAHAPP